MTKPLLFSAFVMNTANHITQGLWRDNDGLQRNFNTLDLWIDLARTLERGRFDTIFFADVVGLYGDYDGGWEHHVRHGLQIPSNDPSVLISALAAATSHIGLAFTAAPMQEPPFNFARRVSTLDHLTGGRLAWNIVTNSLANASRNFSLDDLTEHDERYSWADEYLEVLYKLWEGSWEDGALVQDRDRGVHADPAKVHKIHHKSPRYSVEGPHLVAPSPQRTPFLFQAGSSKAGRAFAARHAEAQFLITPSPESARKLVSETRGLVAAEGRNPESLRFFQGLSFVVGSTEEEALRKERELEDKIDLTSMVAHLGGAIGIDLGGYPLDTPIRAVETQGTQSILAWIRESVGGGDPTIEDVGRLQGRRSRVVGTPEQIADRLGEWQAAGIDGINVVNQTIPGSYVDFIENVTPVLQARGLQKREYQEGTLRHKIFGSDTLDESHVGRSYRQLFHARQAAE
jgi:FMN-dependent oxidoreductase (nitrilotriacetate monooxygenase family)